MRPALVSLFVLARQFGFAQAVASCDLEPPKMQKQRSQGWALFQRFSSTSQMSFDETLVGGPHLERATQHASKVAEWKNAEDAAKQTLHAVAQFESSNSTVNATKHANMTTAYNKTINGTLNNENRTLCRSCVKAEHRLIKDLALARDEHAQAQMLSLALATATKNHEASSADFNHGNMEFQRIKQESKDKLGKITYTASKEEFEDIVAMAKELHPAAVKVTKAEKDMMMHRDEEKSTQKKYNIAAKRAKVADELVAAGQREEKKACAGIGLPPRVAVPTQAAKTTTTTTEPARALEVVRKINTEASSGAFQLFHVGGKLWAIGHKKEHIYEIDPETEKATALAGTLPEGFGGASTQRCHTYEGKILCMHWEVGKPSILLDTVAKKWTSHDILRRKVGSIFRFGNKLFMPPNRYSSYLTILNFPDLSTNDIDVGRTASWSYTVALGDKIVGVPHRGTDDAMAIDVATETVSFANCGDLGIYNWASGGAIVAAGKVFGVPYFSLRMPVYDPATKTCKAFALPTLSEDRRGKINYNALEGDPQNVVVDGKIYFVGIGYQGVDAVEIDASNGNAITVLPDTKNIGTRYAYAQRFGRKIYVFAHPKGMYTIDTSTRKMAWLAGVNGVHPYMQGVMGPCLVMAPSTTKYWDTGMRILNTTTDSISRIPLPFPAPNGWTFGFGIALGNKLFFANIKVDGIVVLSPAEKVL